jgi:ATP-dependent Clp protease adaptor protein ClpS
MMHRTRTKSESRLQRSPLFLHQSRGVAPGCELNVAPLALNRYAVRDRRYRFEVNGTYVSIFLMSAKPLTAELAGPVVSIIMCPKSAAPSTIGTPTIETETREEEALDLPWQVVVHNDPVNLMSYVTMVFQRVFGYPREKAERHMLEVHHKGRSILWSGMRERAELYVQQLHGYLLLATLEKVC